MKVTSISSSAPANTKIKNQSMAKFLERMSNHGHTFMEKKGKEKSSHALVPPRSITPRFFSMPHSVSKL